MDGKQNLCIDTEALRISINIICVHIRYRKMCMRISRT